MSHVSPSFFVLRRIISAAAVLPLTACGTIVMSPFGDIAQQQSQLIVTAVLLMLLIVVPVIVLTLWFAWHYRRANQNAVYTPEWDHSTRLEFVIWGAPLLIIIVLGTITWISTHKLDPYRPLERIDATRPLVAGVKPLVVEVVALDWKWLFVYPELGIATVNELAAPVDRPIEFKITASTVMNSFYIPALAGQIYAMPGMQTKLHGVINTAGVYDGFSANYSGEGFSKMRFKFLGLSPANFDQWVESTKASGDLLGRSEYLKLEKPSVAEPVRRFASVDAGLYQAILNRCVDSSKMCMDQMMAIDAAGGSGKGGIAGLSAKPWRDTQRVYVAALCTPSNPGGNTVLAQRPQP